jgi:hypothetical protein
MVKQKLFEYVVLWHPTKEQHEKGERSKILMGPKVELSNDLDTIKLKAVRTLSEEQSKDLDQIEIAVRPF